MNLTQFLQETKAGLQLEREEEVERNRLLVECRSVTELCKAGVALNAVRLDAIKYGGRQLRFVSRRAVNDPQAPLNQHRLTSGDVVRVCASNRPQEVLLFGVVGKTTEHSIHISPLTSQNRTSNDARQLDIDNRLYLIVQSANDITYRRLERCLTTLESYSEWPGARLVETLFGQIRISFATPDVKETVFFDERLNESQKAAVRFATNERRMIAFVHGPPGTGKTRTVLEIIRQTVARKQRVLLAAPSNVAVDNVLERLSSNADGGLSLLRLGHPARTHAALTRYCLDVAIVNSDQAPVLDDIRAELVKLRDDTRPRWREAKELREDLKSRERRLTQQLLRGAHVVFSTLTGIDFGDLAEGGRWHGGLLGAEGLFDLVVVDECAQATELSCWIALLLGRRAVLAGDHRQLPPTVLSDRASQLNFGRSLMERMSAAVTPEERTELFYLLDVQYRMNEQIMDWSSRQFYDAQLKADDSVSGHLLRDLRSDDQLSGGDISDTSLICSLVLDHPLLYIDTDGCGEEMAEILTTDEESKGNIGEVKLVYIVVNGLVDSGIKMGDIAIISPYNLQVQLLKKYVGARYPTIAIRSVDGFQGQEREAVVLSLVRSNQKGSVGFLSDRRRINVAVTRARRHLCLVGDSTTVGNEPAIKSLLEHCQRNGATNSALEFQDLIQGCPFDVDDSLLFSADVNQQSQKKDIEKATKSRAKPTTNAVENKKSAIVAISSQRTVITHAVVDSPDEGWQLELQAQVDELLASSEMQLSFPTSLTAKQRHFVHELAEQTSLSHVSVGEGNLRKIVLTKPTENTKCDDSHREVSQPTESVVNDRQIPSTLPVAATGTVQSTKAKKKKKPKQSSASVSSTIDNDDDALLEAAMSENAHCFFASDSNNCKRPVVLIGLMCRFCRRRFCTQHAQAEIHGCGEAARHEARSRSGVSGKAGATKNRGLLTSRLDERIGKLEQQRKAQKNGQK